MPAAVLVDDGNTDGLGDLISGACALELGYAIGTSNVRDSALKNNNVVWPFSLGLSGCKAARSAFVRVATIALRGVMAITLRPDHEQLFLDAVRNGGYETTDDAMDTALEMLRSQNEVACQP